jgi:hypothetical protein
MGLRSLSLNENTLGSLLIQASGSVNGMQFVHAFVSPPGGAVNLLKSAVFKEPEEDQS